MPEFVKHDIGKFNLLEFLGSRFLSGLMHQKLPQINLVDPDFVNSVADVLAFGAKKYSPDNWRLCEREDGIKRYTEAMTRHAMAIYRGDKNDPESGLPHAAHAACCAMFILYFTHGMGSRKKRQPKLKTTELASSLRQGDNRDGNFD